MAYPISTSVKCSKVITEVLDSALQGQNPDLFKQSLESLIVQDTWLSEITDMVLGCSAYYNRTDLAVWALENGAKIDSTTRRPGTLPGNGLPRTALYWASSRGNYDIVSLLPSCCSICVFSYSLERFFTLDNIRGAKLV